MHTVLRRGGRSLYALAAYTFEATPPFAIVGMSRPFSLGLPTPYPIGLIANGRHELHLSCGVADRV